VVELPALLCGSEHHSTQAKNSHELQAADMRYLRTAEG
jgi:hypothetical protein